MGWDGNFHFLYLDNILQCLPAVLLYSSKSMYTSILFLSIIMIHITLSFSITITVMKQIAFRLK